MPSRTSFSGCYRAALEERAGWPSLLRLVQVSNSVAAKPTRVLNADDLLFPLWSGTLYFYLESIRYNRWRDWLGLGLSRLNCG